MSLSPGTRLGHYEIRGNLGTGAMGEVYRARDAQLGRDVAIKLVATAIAQNPESIARFEREARILASLNHPNIAAIYGIESAGAIRFLVLELVEGHTLAEVIAAESIPMAQGLDLAWQVADALAAAHEKGVVHRDLKPANLLITSHGKIKVLDFGLAKGSAEELPDTTGSTIAAVGRTMAGTVLGTPAYMSPEQVRGKSVDARTDIWAFGCVLYEMLTGRRAFGGETVSDCIAAILHEDPDWSALRHTTPAAIRRLLVRCLEKDPEHRLHSAADARLEIETARTPSKRSDRRIIAAVAIAALAIAATAIVLVRRPAVPTAARPAMLSQLTLAEGLEESPALSPDARSIAYTAELGGVRKVFVKGLDETGGIPLTSGDFDDIQPSWSPDGETIAFVRSRLAGSKLEPGDVFGQFDGGDVWIARVATREVAMLVENASNPVFSPDGSQVAVDAAWAGPRRIWLTDAAGHNPLQATTDVSEAVVHVRPRWSPDGKRIVFQSIERTKFDVRVVDLASKKLSWVTNDLFQDIQPVWSPAGHFVVFSSNRTGGLNLWRTAMSADGTPQGAPQQLTTGAGQDVEATISTDGKRLAFAILRQNADLWMLPVDPASGRPSGPPREVVATTREDSRGDWSPDGQTIAFNSDRTGDTNLWLHSLRDATTRQLTQGTGGDYQAHWSPDGRTIVFFSSRSGNADIWSVDVASGALRQLTRTPSVEINPAFSPDGEWIAFQSDQSGRLEVWVMRRDGSAFRQLSKTGVGGHFLRWTRDGSAVVFRCPCGGKPQTMRIGLDGGELEPLAEVAGGSHMSFAPDAASILDVVGHKTLWVSPLVTGKPEPAFVFDDADARIDYPVWSPDGRWVLFDRFRPQGGDIWMMEGLESVNP